MLGMMQVKLHVELPNISRYKHNLMFQDESAMEELLLVPLVCIIVIVQLLISHLPQPWHGREFDL